MLMQSDKRSILAVDKDVHMVGLLERIVRERTTYQIITTANSLEVPDLINEHQFDLVISDLKMPGYSGLDLLRMVKERKSKEKIVIITASGNFESAVECLSLGAYNYISKPFSKEQIISVVESAVQIQINNEKAEFLSLLMEKLPLHEAANRFKTEYILRMNSQFEGDIQKMIDASGLSKRQIHRIIKDISNNRNNSVTK